MILIYIESIYVAITNCLFVIRSGAFTRPSIPFSMNLMVSPLISHSRSHACPQVYWNLRHLAMSNLFAATAAVCFVTSKLMSWVHSYSL